MTVLGGSRRRVAQPSWRLAGRFAGGSLALQAIVQILVWVLVDDRSGRTWSSTDFQEWVAISMFCAACLTALAGAVVRRWWVAWAVAVGCFLATALGVAVFVGYAVVNSA